jgi:hypothetical protein
MSVEQLESATEDLQQREVRRRLHECNSNPAIRATDIPHEP